MGILFGTTFIIVIGYCWKSLMQHNKGEALCFIEASGYLSRKPFSKEAQWCDCILENYITILANVSNDIMLHVDGSKSYTYKKTLDSILYCFSHNGWANLLTMIMPKYQVV